MAMFNSLLTPVGEKFKKYNVETPLQCPEKVSSYILTNFLSDIMKVLFQSCPFIRTVLNSLDCSKYSGVNETQGTNKSRHHQFVTLQQIDGDSVLTDLELEQMANGEQDQLPGILKQGPQFVDSQQQWGLPAMVFIGVGLVVAFITVGAVTTAFVVAKKKLPRRHQLNNRYTNTEREPLIKMF